ncbi:protein YeaC [Yersinia pseudotuberculosis]|nr:protein YeaC [Yersinia pseudotuberculosis]
MTKMVSKLQVEEKHRNYICEESIQLIIRLSEDALMELEDLISVMTPEIYQRLVQAVELGKWPDGVALTSEQKENSLQMVMLWQARHNRDAQHMSIGTDGQIVMKTKQELKQQFSQSTLVKLKPE